LKSRRIPHRLHPALHAGIGLILFATLTRIGLAVYADASLTLGALLQVCSRGLYDDEEQKPPEMREVPRVPRRVAQQTLR
jgi:hypothetical protein